MRRLFSSDNSSPGLVVLMVLIALAGLALVIFTGGRWGVVLVIGGAGFAIVRWKQLRS
jgi:uncharacterized membrane protein YjjP (DUF1212 family)